MAAALRGVKGVTHVLLAADGREATVQRSSRYRDDRQLVWAVQDAGYGAWVIRTATLRLAVDGLDCQDCPQKARAALRAVEGTRRVRVWKSTARATVVYAPGSTSRARLIEALGKAGFKARPLD